MENIPKDSSGFPDKSYDVDLPQEEWAAYLLLKDPNLLNAKNVMNAAESAVDFYDPRTRKLAPDDNPVFQQKVNDAKKARETNLDYICFALSDYDRARRLSKESTDFNYDNYLGDVEYQFDVALAEWIKLEKQLRRLLERNTDDDLGFEIDEQERIQEEMNLARGLAFYAWIAMREKLQIFINRIRLAALIISRRTEMRLSQDQFAESAKLSPSTIKNFENVDDPGRWFSAKTVSLMESALGWQPESMTSVLRGGDPTPIPGWAPTELSQSSTTSAALLGTQNAIFNIQLVNHSLYESVELFAAQKGRRIDEVVEDAITLYLKVHA